MLHLISKKKKRKNATDTYQISFSKIELLRKKEEKKQCIK